MLFRGDADVLHRVARAADFDGALITPPNHPFIVVLIAKTLPARLRNSSWLMRAPMNMNVWEGSRQKTGLSSDVTNGPRHQR